MTEPDDMQYHGLDAAPMGDKKAKPAKYDADFDAEFGADFGVDLGADPRDRSLAERVNRKL